MKEDIQESKWISKEGYECEVKLNNILYKSWRCGYVKVPKNHITAQISYSDLPINIHGGLTYDYEEKDGSGTIFGFDCAHSGDTLEIWTNEKVKEEVEKLSKQLSEITWKKIIEKKLEDTPEWFKKRTKQLL